MVYSDRLGRPDEAARGSRRSPRRPASTPRCWVRSCASTEARALPRARERRSAGRPKWPRPRGQEGTPHRGGEVMEEQLSDRDGALRPTGRSLPSTPTTRRRLRMLGSLLGAAERWDELAEVMEREVAAVDRTPGLVAEAAELRYRLGRIRQQRLKDRRWVHCPVTGRSSRSVPHHPVRPSALEDMATGGTGPSAVEAALVLEPVYGGPGRARQARRHAGGAGRFREGPRGRAASCDGWPRVQLGALRHPEAAFLSAARAVPGDPDRPSRIAVAARSRHGGGARGGALRAHAEVADRPRDPAARLELRRHIARLATRSGDVTRAAGPGIASSSSRPTTRGARRGSSTPRSAPPDATCWPCSRRPWRLEEEPAARASLLRELARCWTSAGDQAGAIGALKAPARARAGRPEALATSIACASDRAMGGPRRGAGQGIERRRGGRRPGRDRRPARPPGRAEGHAAARPRGCARALRAGARPAPIIRRPSRGWRPCCRRIPRTSGRAERSSGPTPPPAICPAGGGAGAAGGRAARPARAQGALPRAGRTFARSGSPTPRRPSWRSARPTARTRPTRALRARLDAPGGRERPRGGARGHPGGRAGAACHRPPPPRWRSGWARSTRTAPRSGRPPPFLRRARG